MEESTTLTQDLNCIEVMFRDIINETVMDALNNGYNNEDVMESFLNEYSKLKKQFWGLFGRLGVKLKGLDIHTATVAGTRIFSYKIEYKEVEEINEDVEYSVEC